MNPSDQNDCLAGLAEAVGHLQDQMEDVKAGLNEVIRRQKMIIEAIDILEEGQL
jgi:hypothetical protein